MNQYEILNKVLGERSDYQRGIGYRPKGKGKGKGHASTSSSSSQSQTSHSMSAHTSEDMTAISLVIKAVQDLVSAPTVPPNPNNLFDARIHTFLRKHLPTQQEGASSHSPQPDPATPHSQQSQLPPQNFQFTSSPQFPMNMYQQQQRSSQSPSPPILFNFSDLLGSGSRAYYPSPPQQQQQQQQDPEQQPSSSRAPPQQDDDQNLF